MEAEILNEGYENDPHKNIHSIYIKEMIINPYTSVKNKIPTEGLICNWKFDEGSGNTVYESIDNIDALLDIGLINWVSGIKNSAIYFGRGIVFINSDKIQLQIGTISLWAKTSNSSTGYRGLFAKPHSYSIFLIDNMLGFYDWNGGGNRLSSYSISDDVWHHIALSFDAGVVNGTKIYLDGNLILTTTLNSVYNTENLIIGSGAPGSQDFFGSLDEIKMYNRILTDSEVLQLYNEFK